MIGAVLDANVFVSGIINPQGTPARLFTAWRRELFQLVVSEPILIELGKVLRYPKIMRRHKWSHEEMEQFLDDLRNLAILAETPLSLDLIGEDPSDNRYLECAVAGGADYLVSGDRHLLSLEHPFDFTILTPADLLRQLVKNG